LRIVELGRCAILATTLVALSPAIAQETQTYTYDALGRLTQVSKSRASNPTTPIISSTQFDAAGNRTTYSVTGVPASNGTGPTVIVLPLLGYVVIPISQ
jgi:hypothetical protein